MNFYSMQFVTFLVIALICYYIFSRKQQWICLLVVSAVFYCFTGIENFIFLLLTGASTWIGAKKLADYSTEMSVLRNDKSLDKETKKVQKEVIVKKRRIIMWGVLLVNFGALACLKYVEPILENLGIIGADNVLGLVLPLGISFYTFQSIGYLLDIYYEKYDAEQNFAKYMLFVSYFPQMIQGPINRYDVLSNQFSELHKWDGEGATKAVYRVFYGVLKKYAIANVYAGIIAGIFDNPVQDYSGAIVVFGILLYSAQQYADFSGGIDMVLGISELFGIKMAENFKQPYFSVSLGDFWRRWHISLGKWMRDYVFYPFAVTKPMKKLGKWAGKKFGKHFGRVLPPALGNLLVFLIVGIWHGAEWHYVVWGLYNGAIIAVSDILMPVFDKMVEILRINRKAKWYYVFRVIRTFIVVNIGWYFDRIVSVKEGLYSLKKTFFSFGAERFMAECNILFDGYPSYLLGLSVVACVITFVVSFLQEKKYMVRDMLYKSPVWIRWIIYWLILGIILFANTNKKSMGGFIYANF